MTQGDSELLERWVTVRDADAFKILSKRHAAMVFATCRRILRNDTDAEDIAQDCFIALVHAGSKPGAYLGPWLHKVATNLAIKHLRTESRRKGREAELHTHEAASPTTPDDTLPLIDQAIAELPEKLRLPLVAYYLEDKTHEAIAKQVGITRQGAAYRIQKGVDRVRKSLKRKGVLIGGSALAALLAEETAHAVPPSLSAALGKLALQGAGGPAALASPSAITVARAATGVLAMKAKSFGVAAVCIFLIASAIVVLTLNRNPESTETPFRVATTGTDAASELPTRDQAESPESEPVASVDGTTDDSPDPTVTPLDQPIGQAAPDRSEPEKDSSALLTESSSISGYVADDGGFPIVGAQVTFTDQRLGATTDASGQYTISGTSPSGDAYLSASAIGYTSLSRKFSFSSESEPFDRNFILSPGVNLIGRVITNDGRPIPNALVRVMGHVSGDINMSGGLAIYGVAMTEADGAFALGLEKVAQAIVKVSTPDHGDMLFTQIPVGLPETIELRMEAAPSLAGVISYEDGSPGSNLIVKVEGRFDMSWIANNGEERSSSGVSSSSREVRTDALGGYVISNLTANSGYSAQVKSDAKADLSGTVNLGLFEPGQTVTWDYTLEPPIKITGRITSAPSNQPISDFRLSYMKGDVIESVSRYTGDNSYELRLFEPGSYTIFAHYPSEPRNLAIDHYGKEVTLELGEERELNFELAERYTASVRVVDAAYNPIEGATVNRVRKSQTGRRSYEHDGDTGLTDNEGRHSDTFEPYYDGQFRVDHDKHTSAKTTVMHGEPGEELSEEIVVLYGTGGVEGRIVDSTGRPMANVGVIAFLSAEGLSYIPPPSQEVLTVRNLDQTSSDASGYFAVAYGLPAVVGDVKILVQLEGGGWPEVAVIKDVEIPLGEVVNLGDIVVSFE